MDEQKVCFIMCSNNEFLAEECIRYIENIKIPEGMTKEIQVVTGAVSMAAGYNEAMRKTDAKYKVYLHQDVLIVYGNFLEDTIKLFKTHPEIGMLGMVGNISLPDDGCAWSDGMHRRIGRIYCDIIRYGCDSVFSVTKDEYTKVVVLDGLLMMTQYDVQWREDLFKGWDFYDCSQSLEFWKAGYEVVVPRMEQSWCLHDNDILHLQNYEGWRKVFYKEYAPLYQGCSGENIAEKVVNLKKPAVVYMRFDTKLTDLSFPYPPVFEEEDVDYICFTINPGINSKYWKIVKVDSLEDTTIMKYLEGYGRRLEIKTNQIQVAPIFLDRKPDIEPVITVPVYSELPGISLDMTMFEKNYDENGKYIYKKNPVYQGGKYSGRNLLLTIAIPVSNQVATIDRCLNSIKPLLDSIDAELLIVNTGSKDGTLDVCMRYNARIIEMPWCDNMSAVRNFAINNARGLWYMSIDDDEWFEDVSEILDFFVSGKYVNYDMCSYIQRNYPYSDGKRYSDSTVLRMARIEPELHSEGRIHDALAAVPPVYKLGYQFSSYVHHYGFRRDDNERIRQKYIRNTTGLIYDLIDNPTDLRCNFQLGAELNFENTVDAGINIHIRGISVDKEVHQTYFAKHNAMNIIKLLNIADDARIFYYSRLIKNMYEYSDAEKAFIHYCLAWQMDSKGMSAEEIIQNLESYWHHCEEYGKNPLDNARVTAVGLSMCEDIACRMDALVMGITAYSSIGNTEKALELTERLDINSIAYSEDFFIKHFMTTDAEIFRAILDKFTDMDIELWVEKLLGNAIICLRDIDRWDEAKMRYILSRCSIAGIDKALNYIVEKYDKDVFVLMSNWIATLGYDSLNPQEIYFYSLIMKKTFLLERESVEGYTFFKHYVLLYGTHMGQIYNIKYLTEENMPLFQVADRAVYEIYSALRNSGNIRVAVGHLKRALNYFPGLKKEISNMLEELNQQNNRNADMMNLVNQVKLNAVNLISMGRDKDAIEVLEEIVQYVPHDREVIRLLHKARSRHTTQS